MVQIQTLSSADQKNEQSFNELEKTLLTAKLELKEVLEKN